MSKKYIIPIIVVSLVAGFFGGFSYNQGFSSQPSAALLKEITNTSSGQPGNVDFGTFWQVWNLLESKYVDKSKLDTQAMVYGAIDGLVKSIGDPYTTFFTPKESQSFAQEINGSFGGVGIEIGMRDSIITVISPIKDTPADKAGILADDKIVKIGDKSTEGMNINDAVDLIRGPNGTPVKLTIVRGKETKEFTLIRTAIKVPTVEWKMLDGDTAYIQIFEFNKNVDGDFQKAANEIVKSNAKRIIIDLRNNPGGLLDSAVNLAGFLMDPNKVVTTEKFGDGTSNEFKTAANGELKDYPLVVLINKGSASASEILAGSLKDNRNITLIGEKSFGKGSVQEVDDLPNNASVKITIAKWYTPKGVSISDNGITPDITVTRTEDDFNAGKDPQLDKALEVVRGL